MSGTTAIDREFLAKHAVSAQRSEEARTIFPGGVTHDARHFEPFGIVVDRAVGPRKWDVDGNEYIDYVMGHGALLFGHSHPYLVEAVTAQVAQGTHMGGSSDLERRWAQSIQRLIPSAEKVQVHIVGHRSDDDGRPPGARGDRS